MIKFETIKTSLKTTALHISSFLKRIFAKKTFIIISKGKIRNYEVGTLPQILVVMFFILVLNSVYTAANYNDIIRDKSAKISSLQKTNKIFQKELDSINGDLSKINEYFANSELKKDEENSTKDVSTEDKMNLLFNDLDLDRSQRKTAIKIAEAKSTLDNIKFLAKKKVEDLETKMASTGINFSKNNGKKTSHYDNIPVISLNTKDEISKVGGPLEEIKMSDLESANKDLELKTSSDELSDNLSYLSKIEKFANNAPFFKPMKDYYVSSGFGARIDPFKSDSAIHYGMDFVGKDGSEVLATSKGHVKMSGRFGAYGNIIVIDHGYGITTRYAHLSELKVKKGDIVKKGDVIGIQGSTGRSTGPHLHYEVRYNDTPLDPKGFIQAGEKIFGIDGI